MLKNNNHYNSHFQRAYNKYRNFEFVKLIEFSKIDRKTLSIWEKYFIDIFDSFNDGYNQTTGGEGLGGIKYTKEQLDKKSLLVRGEKNPQSKITEAQFFEIVEMFKDNKSNQEIAEKYKIHDRYVSLIRHKKRYIHLWEKVVDYEPLTSEGNLKKGKITEDQFKEIVLKIKNGATNASIEREYNMSSGSGSRIRHKKLYRQWWKRFFNE